MFLALLMSTTAVVSMNTLETGFTSTSKYHSMTKGVLFQSANPEETLKEFGINPSYSILTNFSAYDYYPFVFPDNEKLQDGFMKEFNTLDIAKFYWKNPRALIRMLDISVRDTIYLRRNYCGNFEISAGMPPMGQSIMWSIWSFFKVNTMPRTIGYLILLLVALILLYRWLSRQNQDGPDMGYVQILQPLVILIIGVGISQALVCIIMSGHAEFGQRAFLLGLAMDIILYLFICKLLLVMKIFEKE